MNDWASPFQHLGHRHKTNVECFSTLERDREHCEPTKAESSIRDDDDDDDDDDEIDFFLVSNKKGCVRSFLCLSKLTSTSTV